jgi:hypothetical protein
MDLCFLAGDLAPSSSTQLPRYDTMSYSAFFLCATLIRTECSFMGPANFFVLKAESTRPSVSTLFLLFIPHNAPKVPFLGLL